MWTMWKVSYKPFVLTAVELQMFGYQACHVCAQLEHAFLSHVHDENDGILGFRQSCDQN